MTFRVARAKPPIELSCEPLLFDSAVAAAMAMLEPITVTTWEAVQGELRLLSLLSLLQLLFRLANMLQLWDEG